MSIPQPSSFVKRSEFLPFSPPAIGEDEIEEVIDTLRSSWITTGPKTRRFEQELGKYLGAPAGVALNSCTAGLHVALVAHGIGAGDEVITTPMTFAASANVIEHVGARPVFVDVEPDTLNIDPERVAAAITPRTRALMVVHYSGHPVEMDSIHAIAASHGLHVIEDAAHALPAEYRGRRIGSGENFAAFSFYATKNLTTAEGGLLTGRADLVDRCRVIALHGMSKDAWKRYEKGGSWKYDIVMPGFKYNMTDIQAAIGLRQLRRLEQMQGRRLEIVNRYRAAFVGSDALELPVSRAHVTHAWHLYMLRLHPDRLTIGRDEFIQQLAERNIGTSVHFIPVHTHPFYADKYNLRPDDLPVAMSNHRRQLSLPLHPGMSNEDVDDVIDAVLDVLRAYRR